MSLEGVRWGDLPKETQDWLLDGVEIDDDSILDRIKEECIKENYTIIENYTIDLNNDLSVTGMIISDGRGYAITVYDDAIIYKTVNGVITQAINNFKSQVNNVMTVNEAANIWGKTEGAIRFAIKSRKFIFGVDYRKSGRITLITKEAMERVYGKLK